MANPLNNIKCYLSCQCQGQDTNW